MCLLTVKVFVGAQPFQHHVVPRFEVTLHQHGFVMMSWGTKPCPRDFRHFSSYKKPQIPQTFLGSSSLDPTSVHDTLQEPVIIWECSGRYDERVMTDHLGDLYVCFSTQANSIDFGFAGNRPRRYGMCLLKSACLPWFCSLKNVINLFHRHRTVGSMASLILISFRELSGKFHIRT